MSKVGPSYFIYLFDLFYFVALDWTRTPNGVRLHTHFAQAERAPLFANRRSRPRAQSELVSRIRIRVKSARQ